MFKAKPVVKKKPVKKLVPGVTDVRQDAPFKQKVNPDTAYPAPEEVQPIPEADGKLVDPAKPHKQRGRPRKDALLPKEHPPKDAMDIDVSKVQNLWERWPDESHDDYGSFKIFLDLGPNRTIRAVAEAICAEPKTEDKVTAIMYSLYRVAQAKKWDERIMARDRYLQRVEDEAAVKKRKERITRNYAMLDEAKDLLEKEIKALKKKRENTPEDRTVMSATQFTNLLDAVMGKEVDIAKMEKEKGDTTAGGGRKVVQQIVVVSAQEVRDQLKELEQAQKPAPNVVDAEFEVVEEKKDA